MSTAPMVPVDSKSENPSCRKFISERPKVLPPDLEALDELPAIQELAKRRQWVLWKSIPNKDGGKPKKVPFQINGLPGDSTDPATWASFDEVVEAYKRGGFSGIGFAFTEDDHYVGIDLDDCFNEDGSLRTEAAKYVMGAIQSYTEVSPSGKGLKMIVCGNVPESFKTESEGIEMYDKARYFTITGRHHQGTPDTIEGGFDAELSAIFERFSRKKAGVKSREKEKDPEGWIKDIADGYKPGSRHNHLVCLAVKFTHSNCLGLEDTFALLKSRNRKECSPAKESEDEIRKIAEWAYEKAQEKREPDEEPEERRELQSCFPDSLALSAPGLVGDITNTIVAASLRPQPAYAVAAALATVGFLKAHRERLDKPDTRTNPYVIGIGGTGSGKEFPRGWAEQLLTELDQGGSIMAGPTSDAGLRGGIARRNGRAFVTVDEIGNYIARVNSNFAGAHETKVLSLLLELFSRANKTYFPPEYAHPKLAEKCAERIEFPTISLLGYTTGETFHEAISSRNLRDGFLPRNLFFIPEKMRPKKNKNPKSEIPPKSIKERAQVILDLPTNAYSGEGNIEDLKINPRIVCLSEEAQAFLDGKEAEFDAEWKRLEDAGNPCFVFYSRAVEHCRKIALIVSEDLERFVVTKEEMEWSCAAVQACIESAICAVRDNMADSEAEAHQKLLLRIIAAAGEAGISRAKLCRKTARLKGIERRDALENLLSCKLIEKRLLSNEMGRPAEVFRAVMN